MAKMMLTFVLILALLATGLAAASAENTTENAPRLLYQGHGSLRIVPVMTRLSILILMPVKATISLQI